MQPNEHTPRPKFDTLFADPRHYRGDLRLFRTAVRRGWLNDAPQADRDALLARYTTASRERHAAGFASDGLYTRTVLAEAWALIEVCDADLAASKRERRCWLEGKGPGDSFAGRPRERWHVGDHPHRLDARELARRTLRDGGDLSTVVGVTVTYTDADTGTPREYRVRAGLVPGGIGGPRLALWCPVCGGRRVFLFATRRGVGCRRCARVGYADRRAR